MKKGVCITGATSGIGYACAQKFSGAGYQLLLIARDEQKLGEIKEKLGENIITTLSADVGDKASLYEKLDSCKNVSIDILINSAGVAKKMDFLYEADIEDWEEMINTNIKGTLYMTKYFLPQMIERKAGHIVNISSISAEHAYKGGNVYCMTKAAINMLAKCLKEELQDTGVKLTNVMPGLVDTNFQSYRFNGDQEKVHAKVGGRDQLSPDEVAEVIFSACEKGFSFSNIEIVKK